MYLCKGFFSMKNDKTQRHAKTNLIALCLVIWNFPLQVGRTKHFEVQLLLLHDANNVITFFIEHFPFTSLQHYPKIWSLHTKRFAIIMIISIHVPTPSAVNVNSQHEMMYHFGLTPTW